MPGISDELDVLLKDYLLRVDVADMLGAQSPKLAMFLSTGRTDANTGRAIPKTRDKMIDGGDKLRRTLKYARNEARGSFSGWSLLNMNPNRKYDAARYPFAGYYGHLPWSIDDLSRYRGETQYVDKMKADLDGLIADAIYDLAIGINNSAAAHVGIQEYGFDGLQILFDNTATWGEIDRDGSNTWWYTMTDTSAYAAADQIDPTSANYLPRLIDARRRAVFNSCGLMPTVCYTSALIYDRLHDIIQLSQQNVNVTTGVYGFEAIRWRGMEVYADPYGMSSGGTSRMELFTPQGFDDKRTLGIVGQEGYFFDMTDWIPIANQAAQVKRLYCKASIYCDQPRMQAALTGLTE